MHVNGERDHLVGRVQERDGLAKQAADCRPLGRRIKPAPIG